MAGPRPDVTDTLVHYIRAANPEEAFRVLKNILREPRPFGILVKKDWLFARGAGLFRRRRRSRSPAGLCGPRAPLPQSDHRVPTHGMPEQSRLQ